MLRWITAENGTNITPGGTTITDHNFKMKPMLNSILFFAAIALNACGLQEISNFNVHKKESPDKSYLYSWYNRDAGATTSVATALAIYPVGEEESLALNDPVLVIAGELSASPKVEWESLTSVKIYLAGVKRDKIFIKSIKRGFISIIFIYDEI